MKQKLYAIGIINLLIVLTGAIFKINHWPGAGILLTIGMGAVALFFIPLALVNSYKYHSNNSNKLLYIITGITSFVVFTAMMFKIMHWPFASVAMTIALPFPYVVFLPVFLVVTSRTSHFSIYNTVFVLFLLALVSVFSALLSVNVTRYKIDDTFNISGSINNVKLSLLEMPENKQESSVVMRIDESLEVIDQYQVTILKQIDLTEDQWNNNPEILLRPDARDVALAALHDDADLAEGSKLKKALDDLVMSLGSAPGLEEAARAISSMAGLQPDEIKKPYYGYFTDEYLIWTMIYLDGLEINLRLLKASLI